MIIKIDESKCTACGKCVARCPVEAIHMRTVAKWDPARCIDCCICITVCPVKAITNR